MPTPAVPQDDDDLDELPPLDGEAEREEEPDYSDMVDDAPSGEQGDPLDDRTGEDDPVDDEELDTLNGKASETGWLDDAQDAENLDIGATELVTFEADDEPLADHDEPGVGEEDYGFGEDDGATDLDGGEEGPLAMDEDLREEELPRLDADEEGDVDDADLVDPSFETDGGVPWAARQWTPVFAPNDMGRVTAIASGPRGVVASAGNGPARLVRVDLEGGTEPLAAQGLSGDVVALAFGASALVALAADSVLYVSTDDGATFAPVATGVRDVALSLGVLWTLTTARTLKRSRDLGRAWEDVAGRSSVDAICAIEAGAVVTIENGALVRDPATPIALPDAAPPQTIVARGAFTACFGAGKVRIHDGEAWRTVDVPGASAATFVDDKGTLVVAAYRESDDATWLVRIDAQAQKNGAQNVVAEIGATRDDEENDARVHALVRDDARGVLWVGGGFGVIAFELP